MNEQIKDIGMRLMFLREEAELSEKEMAEKLGVDEETYRGFESGDKDFSFSLIYNAADISAQVLPESYAYGKGVSQ